ncbi:MAG: RNA methyltransferase [Candidatus Moranbacteria bacterium CG10_big_fil_rev_8_21_14_0_10_35_21]|nr:MAG: RNA methyltransferase [Candidatus Moranbacteria bacterium CG10_big_fil_rev_8_21_14_0_10_35_21]PJA88408.1 MAG: RNA methyltransferase [Candidatus Moranbacteria bacterium CG_4_9_14_3_um_filter_36_9]
MAWIGPGFDSPWVHQDMKKDSNKKNIAVVLHNIRSAHNVGSIFRTSDAVGVEKIYLGGITPAPIDRFGREVKEIHKVALGAEKFIPWEVAGDIFKIIQKLKSQKFEIVALEKSDKSIRYNQFKSQNKNLALILGSETEGLSEKFLNLADQILEIPMSGKKESLNVSVAFGIAIFEIIK